MPETIALLPRELWCRPRPALWPALVVLAVVGLALAACLSL